MTDIELIFGLMATFGKHEYLFSDIRHLTAPFNISETNLRTILSRMAQRRIIQIRSSGKRSFYRFTNKSAYISSNVSQSLKQPDWSNWNQRWWGVLFSVPESRKDERYRIRKLLTQYRFAGFTPGFWARPQNAEEHLEISLRKVFEHEYCRIINFKPHKKISPQEARQLWKLTKTNSEFKKGLSVIQSIKSNLHSVSPEEALVQKMLTGGVIVAILFKDPLLPDIFLPENWLGNLLRKEFLELDETLTQLSRSYWSIIYQ